MSFLACLKIPKDRTANVYSLIFKGRITEIVRLYFEEIYHTINM